MLSVISRFNKDGSRPVSFKNAIIILYSGSIVKPSGTGNYTEESPVKKNIQVTLPLEMGENLTKQICNHLSKGDFTLVPVHHGMGSDMGIILYDRIGVVNFTGGTDSKDQVQ